MKFTILVMLVSTVAFFATGLKWGEPAKKEKDFVGFYNVLRGPVNQLYLYADGRYKCRLGDTPPMSCANWNGHGPSSGTWELNGNVVHFSPEKENANLVLSLHGATGLLNRGFLRVRIKEQEFPLRKQAEIYFSDESEITELVQD